MSESNTESVDADIEELKRQYDLDEVEEAELPDPEQKGEFGEFPEAIQRKAPDELAPSDFDWLNEEGLEKSLPLRPDAAAPRHFEAVDEETREQSLQRLDAIAESKPAVEERAKHIHAALEEDESDGPSLHEKLANAPDASEQAAADEQEQSPRPAEAAEVSEADESTDESEDMTPTEKTPAEAVGEGDEPVATSESRDETGESNDASGETDDNAPDNAPEETRTLEETGLLDDDGEFPWDEEGVVETGMGDIAVETVSIKGAELDVREPDDMQKVENASADLSGMGDAATDDEKADIIEGYQEELAHICLFQGDVPLEQLHLFRRPGDKTNLILNERDHEGSASHDRTEPLWEAATGLGRMKMRSAAFNLIHGDEVQRAQQQS